MGIVMATKNDLVFYIAEDDEPKATTEPVVNVAVESASGQSLAKKIKPAAVESVLNKGNASDAIEDLSWEERLESLRQLRTHEPKKQNATIAGFINRSQENKQENKVANHLVQPVSSKEPIAVTAPRYTEQTDIAQPVRIGKNHLPEAAVAAPAVEEEVFDIFAKRPVPTEQNENEPFTLEATQKQAVYESYLNTWQQQHNLSQSLQDDVEFLFKQDWFAEQGCILLTNESVAVDSERLMFIQCVDSKEKGEEDQEDKQFNHDGLTEQADTWEVVDAAEYADNQAFLPESDQPIAVNLQVIAPLASQKRVVCLDEKEVVARLSSQLETHLSNAIAGLLRTEVQKYTAQLLQQVQSGLTESLPDVVKEVIDHNIDTIMADIKTSQS